MTEISVTATGAYTAEKRSWLLGPHGVGPGDNPGCTLDASLFTANTHYPNGYLPSGTVIGGTNAAAGPYSGTGAALGILFSSVRISSATAKIGGALVRHGMVNTSKLPFTSGTGSLGAGGVAALPLIDFSSTE